MRYITLDEIVANALTIMPKADDETRVAMRQWVYLGKRKIGPSKADIKQVTITMANNRFRKPDDFLFGTDISLLDSEGREKTYQHEGRGFPTKDASTGRRNEWVDTYHITEDNDFYYLSGTVTVDQVNVMKMRLEYYGLPLDEGGNIKINESETEALMAYLRYMYAMREQDPNINLYREIYLMEMARVRRQFEIPDMVEAKEGIFRKYMSMINKPLRDDF